MKLHRLWPVALVALLAAPAPLLSLAAPVAPFTEEFPTDPAQWTDGPPTGFATWVLSGGPSGASDGYIAAPADATALPENASVVLFRGNSTTSPSIHASGDKFAGDWLNGGINQFSAWVFNGSPYSVPLFARFTQPSGGTGVAAFNGTTAAPNSWTQLSFVIAPSEINTTLFPEGPSSLYSSVFGNMGRIQIGFNVPAAMATAGGGVYTFGLDKVAVNTPEPTSLLLGLGAAAFVATRRRRTA